MKTAYANPVGARMDYQQMRTIAETATAVGAAVATLYAGWRWGWPILGCAWGRITSVWGTLERLKVHFDPDSKESIPARLQALTDQGNVRGRQLNDMQRAQTLAVDTMARLDKKIDTVADTQRAVLNTNPKVASFEADAGGNIIKLNRTFQRWTGVDSKELLNMGWLSSVHAADRARVRANWASAVAEGRRYEDTFRLVHAANGAVTTVAAQADPIPDPPARCERWQGALYLSAAKASSVAA